MVTNRLLSLRHSQSGGRGQMIKRWQWMWSMNGEVRVHDHLRSESTCWGRDVKMKSEEGPVGDKDLHSPVGSRRVRINKTPSSLCNQTSSPSLDCQRCGWCGSQHGNFYGMRLLVAWHQTCPAKDSSPDLQADPAEQSLKV